MALEYIMVSECADADKKNKTIHKAHGFHRLQIFFSRGAEDLVELD